MRGISPSAFGLAAALIGAGTAHAAPAEETLSDTRLERAFFGGESMSSRDLSRVGFWENLLSRVRTESLAARGAKTDSAQADWREMVWDVNASINAAPFVTDADNYGQADRWQTPRELAARGGDCEDYAAAKYFALRAAGAPASALRIAVVTDERERLRHAVLMVEIEGQAFVLDNLSDAVLPAAALPHYRPLMAMNEENWQLAAADLRRAQTFQGKTEAPATSG